MNKQVYVDCCVILYTGRLNRCIRTYNIHTWIDYARTSISRGTAYVCQAVENQVFVCTYIYCVRIA